MAFQIKKQLLRRCDIAHNTDYEFPCIPTFVYIKCNILSHLLILSYIVYLTGAAVRCGQKAYHAGRTRDARGLGRPTPDVSGQQDDGSQG